MSYVSHRWLYFLFVTLLGSWNKCLGKCAMQRCALGDLCACKSALSVLEKVMLSKTLSCSIASFLPLAATLLSACAFPLEDSVCFLDGAVSPYPLVQPFPQGSPVFLSWKTQACFHTQLKSLPLLLLFASPYFVLEYHLTEWDQHQDWRRGTHLSQWLIHVDV